MDWNWYTSIPSVLISPLSRGT